MCIIRKIKAMILIKKRKKIDPLRYSLILKEKGFECGTTFFNFPIDESMYIETFITEAGIQSCGLYFKIVRYDDTNSQDAGEGKIIDICRISMEKPEYITGFDETFKLNENQKRNMISVLNKKFKDSDVKIWDYMFDTMNAPRDFTDKFPKLEILPMPDYSLLK